jgi:hydroxymethylpyrimidine kinase/phosphomethylpyrimidine kinase
VWDPIAAPSRGSIVFDREVLDATLETLKPHLTLVTPNVRELEVLTQSKIDDLDAAITAGTALATRLDAAVLVKGGHLGGDESIDVLLHPGGRDEFRGPRVSNGEHVHGTGCALASAIAANLAAGKDLVESCRLAKDYVAERIADPASPGRGAKAVL